MLKERDWGNTVLRERDRVITVLRERLDKLYAESEIGGKLC